MFAFDLFPFTSLYFHSPHLSPIFLPGKMDELRARRAAEEKERDARAREKAEAIKRKNEMKELLESRARQAEDKVRRQQALRFEQEDMIRDQLQFSLRQEQREVSSDFGGAVVIVVQLMCVM